MDFDNTEAVNQLAKLPTEPPKPVERGLWRTALDSIRGSSAKAIASTLEVGGVIGAGMVADLDNGALDKAKAPIDFGQNEQSKPMRDFERSLRPDPVTAGKAEQIVYGLVGPALGIVGSAVVGGVPGLAGASAEMGFSQAEDLRQQGVDLGTRTAIGALTTGVNTIGGALPIAGQTLKATAGLYAVGGPGAFVVQQLATSEILKRANYAELATQYDPLDPTGLLLSAVPGLPFAAMAGLRNVRTARAAKAAERSPAPDTATEVATAQPAAPEPVATVDRGAVDAAMVHNLTLDRDVSDGRLQGVASQIVDGRPDRVLGIDENVIGAAQKLREFVAGPARDPLDNSTKINIATITEDSAQRIREATGIEVGIGARHEVRADAARHANQSHPDLTEADWSALPWLAENFDRAVLLKAGRADQGPRVALAAMDPVTGYAYVAEYRVGKKKGERLSLVTFFRDKPGSVEAYLRTNGRDSGGASVEVGTPDAPVLPKGPEVLTPETNSGGWRSVTPPEKPGTAAAGTGDAGLGPIVSTPGGLQEAGNAALGLPPGTLEALGDTPLAQALKAPEQQPKAGNDPLMRSVADRVAKVEAATPQLEVGVGPDGQAVTAAELLSAARREAQDGTDSELGANDAKLLRAAVDCALS